MRRRDVVTCFLRRHGKVLLLRRSAHVRTYAGKWNAVSGTIEARSAREQAYVEIGEETGLTADDVTLVTAARPLEVAAPEIDTLWIVHAFLFNIAGDPAIHLNWENDEVRWVDPEEIGTMDTVPQLRNTWTHVAS